MPTYTIYQITDNTNRVFVGHTTKSLQDEWSEHQSRADFASSADIQSLAILSDSTEEMANMAECFYKEKLNPFDTNLLNSNRPCNSALLQAIREAEVEFQQFSAHTVGWIYNRYNKHRTDKHRITQACSICGKVGLVKNMAKHQQSRRCKESNSPPPTDEQKALALKTKKDKLSETQNAKVACSICGFMTSKRNMKRHQQGANCKPPLA